MTWEEILDKHNRQWEEFLQESTVRFDELMVNQRKFLDNFFDSGMEVPAAIRENMVKEEESFKQTWRYHDTRMRELKALQRIELLDKYKYEKDRFNFKAYLQALKDLDKLKA